MLPFSDLEVQWNIEGGGGGSKLLRFFFLYNLRCMCMHACMRTYVAMPLCAHIRVCQCERTYVCVCVCVCVRCDRYVVVHLHARAFACVRVCVLLCVTIVMRQCISVRSFVRTFSI